MPVGREATMSNASSGGREPNTSTWVRHEGGWYTLKGVGGICRERGGWAFWPPKGEPMRGFDSMAQAKRAAILGYDPRVSHGWTRDMSGDWL